MIEVRLRALARSLANVELADVDTSIGDGAGSAGDIGYFFVSEDPRALGRALRWATSQSLDRVEVLAGSGASDLARRAELIGCQPRVGVWAVDGAEVSPAEPGPCAQPPTLPADHWALAGIMSEAGASPIDDYGVLVGEVAGLEIARVVDGFDGPVIDIGVGQADRELNQFVHSDLDIDTGLRRVIAAVAEFRSGHAHHPLTRLARERWLRASLVDDPSAVGATHLEPLVPLRPRQGLMATQPAACHGQLASGEPVVVVTMVGVDLDLVPEAVDYRHRCDPSAQLILAMPGRDLDLNVGLLEGVERARAMAIEGPWIRSGIR